MPSDTKSVPPSFVADLLRASGDGAPSLDDKLSILADLRRRGPRASGAVDRALLEELDARHAALVEVREKIAALRAIHEELTAPPWLEATYLGEFDGAAAAASGNGAAPPQCVVLHGGARRVVTLADGFDRETLRRGDAVFLGEHLNVILARAESPTTGEIALFERHAPAGRIVLRQRDDEFVVEVADGLLDNGLRRGDPVRWDRAGLLAHEKIERGADSEFFLEKTPEETFESVGGLDEQILRIQLPILLRFRHSDIVARYRLRPTGSILLVGPPGTGKTMLARCTANWLASITGSKRVLFMSIKPGELQSMWYGQSEANVRELFRAARQAGEREPDAPVVIFIDEVDSLGAARGHLTHRADRGVLLALAAELNGLRARGNVLVITATNRCSDLDPALLRPGRLGDEIVTVPRPDRRAAREILSKHLETDLPYGAGGAGDHKGAREEILDAAMSRVFAPNGDGELATLVYRDGSRQRVAPVDLVTGAVLASAAAKAKRVASVRAAETGEDGVRLDDVLGAIAAEFETAARAITPLNCRQHVDGLRRDVDVVEVRHSERRVKRQHRFLTLP